ncbi:dehypoxanthine futalosine cyclase [Desulfovibrio sulfodismutans]|uniref:Cyclic dehypoxanthine futalosine synthase n=1 Tax=Desulfolutivibrio sulfodismutans TaxID=63561 RepID=A0A7K3NGZ3_9BACT|nr:cyclic dehypoxanthinyl futalosine synthase [Desulfolutivibrio sulfodismutans]NDY55357.1 dehypoxanthine futalosine cyclase [Desulfolutivibrio sulfodismutans]QLA11058.1 dehypoxanthine futalosine cyclase [Desulfolutivibrio sulfodismutans DSM 3696]
MPHSAPPSASQAASGRLDASAAVRLWEEADVFTLGRMADDMRRRLHPGTVVTYIVDRNINYTNICACGCRFCAFFTAPGQPGGYVLSREELAAKVRETVELGGYQILLQGGMHPDLDLSFYTGMLAFLKTSFPQVAIHGFSPPEIVYWAKKEKKSIAWIIDELKAAGLDSIPGGGAEILVDAVRSKVSPNKCPASEWLEVMATAHGLGLRTTATMMFGMGETIEDRIEHLEKIRVLQDATGGFTAFIPWTFQPANTNLPAPELSSWEYLRFLALSRLFLDNIPNIQASWVTQGPKIGQLALFWGANDFGSTMIEENVVAAAGVSFRLPEDELRRLVHTAGFTPMRRNMDYSPRD